MEEINIISENNFLDYFENNFGNLFIIAYIEYIKKTNNDYQSFSRYYCFTNET